MAPELLERRVVVESDHDVVVARQEGRSLARELGFGPVEQARITTAVSELARNIVIYAGRGAARFRKVQDGAERVGLEIRFEDEGPGIADIERAMQQGYSSGKGLGAGLPGSRRLMDEFEIHSEPGKGVHIRMCKWR